MRGSRPKSTSIGVTAALIGVALVVAAALVGVVIISAPSSVSASSGGTSLAAAELDGASATATSATPAPPLLAAASARAGPESGSPARNSTTSESPGSIFFVWLPVSVNSTKPARGSVSLI